MERLTKRMLKGTGYYMKCSESCPYDCQEDCDCEEFDKFIDRLAAIENILGDDYDLDRLEVMVTQCMTLRDEVAERFSITAKIPLDRLRELVEADRDRNKAENCKHVFVYDEVHSRPVCQKCGYVLTAEDKQRICKEGLELLEAESCEATAALKGERNG